MAKSKVLKYLSNATGVGKKSSKTAEAGNILTGRFLLEGAATAAVDGTVAAAKGANKLVPFTRKTEANMGNLWTGRKEGPGAIIAGTVIAAGYTGYSTVKQTSLAPRVGEVSYGGSVPIMDADGVSSRSQAPSLGAGGNMVFGLHNARKG